MCRLRNNYIVKIQGYRSDKVAETWDYKAVFGKIWDSVEIERERKIRKIGGTGADVYSSYVLYYVWMELY